MIIGMDTHIFIGLSKYLGHVLIKIVFLSCFFLSTSDKGHSGCQYILVGIGAKITRSKIVTENPQIKFKDVI